MADLGEGDSIKGPYRRYRRLVAVLVALVLVAGSIAFVVSRRDSLRKRPFSITALAASMRQESARVRLTVTIPRLVLSGRSASGSLFVEDGLFDFRHQVAQIKVTDGSYSFGTEILIGKAVYTTIGPDTAVQIPSGVRRTKRWVETRQRNAGFPTLDLSDPLARFSRHAAFRDLGMSRINSRNVRHYRGTEHLPYAPSTSGSQTLTVVFDLYIDADNQLVRLYAATTEPAAHVPATTSKLDFSDYGVRVTVTAPPARDVYVVP